MQARELVLRVREGVWPAVVIVGCGLFLGAAANVVSPRRIPWVEDWAHHVEARAFREGISLINTDEAWKFHQEGAHLFLDARSEKDFAKGHIPGAFSVPHALAHEYLAGLQGILTPEQPVVAYCSGADCDESLLLAIELKRMGMTNIVLYAGGFQKWRERNLPVEASP